MTDTKKAPCDGQDAGGEGQKQHANNTTVDRSIRNDYSRLPPFERALEEIVYVDPVAHDDPAKGLWYTAYEMCREARRVLGILNKPARLTSAALEMVEDALIEYADDNGLDYEMLIDFFEQNWPTSMGPHRWPMQSAIRRWSEINHESVTLSRNRPKLNMAATFCALLAEESGGEFFLSCRDLGEVLGFDHMTANRQLNVLVEREYLEVVGKREHKREAKTYRLKCYTK